MHPHGTRESLSVFSPTWESDIKQKSTLYWEEHKDLINERRRQRYALTHPPPPAQQQPELR